MFQHHIYGTMSSDPGEEKLDASEFHKDWDFHNHHNDELVAPSAGEDESTVVPPAEKGKRTKDKRTSVRF